MDKQSSGPVTTLAKRGGAMRLTLSASVASDIGALKSSLQGLAERLGHASCATGCDILHIGLEREFVVNQKGTEVELNPQPLPPMWHGLASEPMPGHPVPVTMPAVAFNDIKVLGGAIERVLGKLGCAACCSGFDIIFQREMDHIALDAKLNVHGFGNFA